MRGNFRARFIARLAAIHTKHSYFDPMKTMTIRKFFRCPSFIKALRSGQSVLVTENGKPALVVTKLRKRRRKNREQIKSEARALCALAVPKLIALIP